MTQLARTYKRSGVPLYLQVATTLTRRIETGQWKPGQRISTLDELESEFQVSRVTVRQAVDVLQRAGLLRSEQGRGTFVADQVKDRRWLQLETEWSSLIGTIEDNVPRFLDSKDVPALGLGRDEGELAEDYEYLRSVQSRNGIAYAVADVHLARHVFERAPEMFRAELALPALSKIGDIGIAKAHQTLVIGSADTETAQLLNIALNAPTAEAHCVVTDTSGVAIYIGDIIYRGDCVKLDINLLPNVAGDQADDGSA